MPEDCPGGCGSDEQKTVKNKRQQIKVVQIAVAVVRDQTRSQYLDDRGRVWFETREKYIDENNEESYKWVWKQVTLPEEPR